MTAGASCRCVLRTLLIDSGRQLPMCSKSHVPLGRSKDWLAFSFSGTLPGISHIVYTLYSMTPGPSSTFRFGFNTVLRSGPEAEPVLAHNALLTSLAFTASSILSLLGSARLARLAWVFVSLLSQVILRRRWFHERARVSKKVYRWAYAFQPFRVYFLYHLGVYFTFGIKFPV